MSAPPATPLFALHDIGKDYAAPVLDGVSLTLEAGEVLALTGENGAGKSTLSKIVCGLVTPTRGTMLLGGAPFQPGSRRDAEAHGVRMVMQELGLVPTLTVAENLLLDRLPQRMGWLQRTELHAAARLQLAKIGLSHIDPAVPVSRLGIGQQQMVEIARNLLDDTRVLILDEPTAMLTPRETEHLFEQIALLKARGVGIVYVSHRLEELQRIADRVAVLRDGRLVDVRPMAGVRESELVERMVGRAVHEHDGRPRRVAGAPMLSAHGIGRGSAVRDVDLQLRAGEVMGIAGLVGSGRTELVRLLFGADKAERGTIELHWPGAQQPAAGRWRSPMQAIRAGIGLVTEDRKSQGLLMTQSIRVNATLSDLGAVSRLGWLRAAAERGIARRLVQTLRIRSRSEEQSVATLSGGNQQKVVFARWLHRECKVLLLDEPTRGVDVGARADLYAELDRMAEAGKALLMVSSDLRELMAMCDRIGVMHAGRLVAVFERGAWDQQSILAAAFGDTGRATSAAPTAHALAAAA
ncbi:sugar ABC transporter ATP-binding protein [Variovorax sp. DAIF25]|uniref:sugar ABC transporter ATP-binding protein n=1 Tax=Variovorax sp. DAIF25 TaxID=3080983 RepID=UPI003D6AFA5B